MQEPEYEPLFIHARREAAIILAAYAAAILYTLAYCYSHDFPAAEIETWLGIPEWVLWGVFLPWGACILFTAWFCFFYMKDDPLDPPKPDEQTGAISSVPESFAGESE